MEAAYCVVLLSSILELKSLFRFFSFLSLLAVAVFMWKVHSPSIALCRTPHNNWRWKKLSESFALESIMFSFILLPLPVLVEILFINETSKATIGSTGNFNWSDSGVLQWWPHILLMKAFLHQSSSETTQHSYNLCKLRTRKTSKPPSTVYVLIKQEKKKLFVCHLKSFQLNAAVGVTKTNELN